MATEPSPPPLDVAPSSRYAFEPEFTGLPPRALPDRLADGPYARRRRATALALAAAGAACLLFSRAPGVDVLARYVLPLAYLQWIGIGLVVLAAGVAAALALRTGPFRYVRDGHPLAARVVELLKTPTAIVNGAPSTHALVAAIVFREPGTGDLVQAQVKSNDFSSARKDAYDAPFKVGDDVTAVYLPGRLDKTLRLYAFLDLSPDVNLTPRERVKKDESPWKLAALLAAIPAFFLVLFANVYAFGRYHPLRFEYRQALAPLIAGGVLLGGGLFAALYVSHRSEQRELHRRALQALATGAAVETGTPFLGAGLYGWFLRVVMAAGAPLLGALTALCWCFMANAWLDRSPAQPVPATIERRLMKTHAFLFREFELEYRVEGSPEKHTLLTTPEHLSQLEGAHGTALVRATRVGLEVIGWNGLPTGTPRMEAGCAAWASPWPLRGAWPSAGGTPRPGRPHRRLRPRLSPRQRSRSFRPR